jgi:alpha-beta hydrolase superfamily lysophospholipase
MRCLCLRRLASGFLAVVTLFFLSQASRAADPERVKFLTFDEVEIHGSFYSSEKGSKAPCALLLHAIGGSSQDSGWDELAKKLNAKGFAVLTFDFRGHGDSTSVGPNFWMVRENQLLKNYRASKPRETISYKDFTTRDNFLTLVNDIAAAKRQLDQKNDAQECNSANLVVIGADTGATLGALWIQSEWSRYKPVPFGAPTRPQLEGQDVACAVWLSISPDIGIKGKLWRASVDSWLAPPVKEKVPMYFLYGDQDSRSATFAKHLCDQVLRAEKDPKMKLTGKRPIKETKLAGIELVKPSLETSTLVVTYAQKVIEDRGIITWSDRDTKRTTLYRVPYERFAR